MEKYRLVQESKVDLMMSGNEEFSATGNTTTTSHHSGGSVVGTGVNNCGWPEVRITQQGKNRNYISYALNLFTDGSTTIVLRAMGRAINKAVTIAEIVKRKLPLHQWNCMGSVEMVDVYEPLEEGLDIVQSRRYVSCLTITLSLSLTDPATACAAAKASASGNNKVAAEDEEEVLDSKHSGYQPPLPVEEMHSVTAVGTQIQ